MLPPYYSNLIQLDGDMKSVGRREGEPGKGGKLAHKYSLSSAYVFYLESSPSSYIFPKIYSVKSNSEDSFFLSFFFYLSKAYSKSPRKDFWYCSIICVIALHQGIDFDFNIH